jgi:hypothetical protein
MPHSPIDPAALPPVAAQPSNRSVGLLLATAIGAVGLWPLISGQPVRIWALACAAVLLVAALMFPRILTPVAWLWLSLGKILHTIVSPIVLGLVYAVAVLPTGLYLRAAGKDPLRLKPNPDASSYWIERDPPGPSRDSLPRQF